MNEFDDISRPRHYAEGRTFEPKDVIAKWGLNFNVGNAVKYLARAGRKGDELEDLKKCRQYILFEIENRKLIAENNTGVLPIDCVSEDWGLDTKRSEALYWLVSSSRVDLGLFKLKVALENIEYLISKLEKNSEEE